jgi:hypothetical protein
LIGDSRQFPIDSDRFRMLWFHTRAVSGLSTSRLNETVDHHGISRIDWWISAVSHRQRSFEKIFHDQFAYVSSTISYGKWRCFQRAVSVHCCSHCHICPASSSHFLSYFFPTCFALSLPLCLLFSSPPKGHGLSKLALPLWIARYVMSCSAMQCC